MNIESTSEAKRPSVLIVDENVAIRTLSRRALEAAGYRVREADDGIDALNQLEQEQPDIVLVDLVVPRLPGLDLLRRRAERGNVGIVILSGYGDPDQEVACLEAGADDYIKKPFSPRILVARVGAVVRRLQAFPTPPAI